MQLSIGTTCLSSSRGLCTDRIILPQQTLTSLSCTEVPSLGIVPPRTFRWSCKSEFPRINSFSLCPDSRKLKLSPVAPTALYILRGSFNTPSSHTAPAKRESVLVWVFLVFCAWWEPIFLCVCCRAFCVMPIIPLTLLLYAGKSFWLMNLFTQVRKNEETPFKPSELWRQRGISTVLFMCLTRLVTLLKEWRNTLALPFNRALGSTIFSSTENVFYKVWIKHVYLKKKKKSHLHEPVRQWHRWKHVMKQCIKSVKYKWKLCINCLIRPPLLMFY